MESEGPYTHGCYSTGKYLCPACIYADGRKAGEKEFKELLDLANGMFDRIIEGRSCAKAVKDFDAWKKARGIE